MKNLRAAILKITKQQSHNSFWATTDVTQEGDCFFIAEVLSRDNILISPNKTPRYIINWNWDWDKLNHTIYIMTANMDVLPEDLEQAHRAIADFLK